MTAMKTFLTSHAKKKIIVEKYKAALQLGRESIARNMMNTQPKIKVANLVSTRFTFYFRQINKNSDYKDTLSYIALSDVQRPRHLGFYRQMIFFFE